MSSNTNERKVLQASRGKNRIPTIQVNISNNTNTQGLKRINSDISCSTENKKKCERPSNFQPQYHPPKKNIASERLKNLRNNLKNDVANKNSKNTSDKIVVLNDQLLKDRDDRLHRTFNQTNVNTDQTEIISFLDNRTSLEGKEMNYDNIKKDDRLPTTSNQNDATIYQTEILTYRNRRRPSLEHRQNMYDNNKNLANKRLECTRQNLADDSNKMIKSTNKRLYESSDESSKLKKTLYESRKHDSSIIKDTITTSFSDFSTSVFTGSNSNNLQPNFEEPTTANKLNSHNVSGSSVQNRLKKFKNNDLENEYTSDFCNISSHFSDGNQVTSNFQPIFKKPYETFSSSDKPSTITSEQLLNSPTKGAKLPQNGIKNHEDTKNEISNDVNIFKIEKAVMENNANNSFESNSSNIPSSSRSPLIKNYMYGNNRGIPIHNDLGTNSPPLSPFKSLFQSPQPYNFNNSSTSFDSRSEITSTQEEYQPEDMDCESTIDDNENHVEIEELNSSTVTCTEENEKKELIIIVDTNIFLHHLSKIKEILNLKISGSNQIVVYIPWMVIIELDCLKDTGQNKSLKSQAFDAIKFINTNLLNKHPRLLGQSISDVTKQKNIGPSPDDNIIACTFQMLETYQNVILLSNDINLRNKALINNIPACSSKEILIKIMGNIGKNNKFQKILHKMSMICTTVICKCAKETYGSVWNKMDLLSSPPWSFQECLKRFRKYYESVFKELVYKQFLKVVQDLINLLDDHKYICDDSEDFILFMKNCLNILIFLKDINHCSEAVKNTLNDLKVM